MTGLFFIFFILLAYPIIAFFIISLTQSNIRLGKIIFFVLLGLTVLVLLASFNRVSTIYLTLNWVLGLTIYLFISVILWWLKFKENIYLKIISVIGIIFVFGFGVFLGLFATYTYFIDMPREQKFSDGLIYREYTLGHATTENRGKHVEIYQIVHWLPIIETFVQEKTYNSLIRYNSGEENYENKLTVNYAPNTNKIYLSTIIGGRNGKEKWADTLIIKK